MQKMIYFDDIIKENEIISLKLVIIQTEYY